MYRIVHRKHTAHTKTLMRNVTKKDLTIFLQFNIETGFKHIIFKITLIRFNYSCQKFNILNETIKHAYMQPIKTWKIF